MTVFSHQKIPTRNHPYAVSEAAQAPVRKYMHLRMRLFPYLYNAALETRLRGTKMVHGDGVHEYQYQLGNDLLVAPVFVKGATQRTVCLPAGNWIEWDSDRLWPGDQTITVAAPVDRIPLLVREGAVVPLRDYAPSIEQGTNDRLTLEVYPSTEPTTYVLHEDDGRSNGYLEGRIAATEIRAVRTVTGARLEILPVRGTFAGMKPERQLTIRFHRMDPPGTVTHDDSPASYTYDSSARIVTVTVSQRKAASTTVETREDSRPASASQQADRQQYLIVH